MDYAQTFCLNSEPESQLYEDGRGFRFTSTGSLVVYTDGSCLANGRENPLASIGVFFGLLNENNVSRQLSGDYAPSNNTAEIVAVTTAFRLCKRFKYKNVQIRTDSQYLIDCLQNHVSTWMQNGWKKTTGKPVVNAIELKELLEEMVDLTVEWVHVRGHAHDMGNRCVDFLARMATINQFLERQNYELIDYKLEYKKKFFQNKYSKK